MRVYQKPLMVHTSFAREPYRALEILRSGGIPVFDSSDRTAQAISALMHFAGYRAKTSRMAYRPQDAMVPPSVGEILTKARAEGRKNLLETECREILARYGITLPEALLAGDQDEAVSMAAKIGFPAAMKVVSPDILHKSDVGGVKLNLRSEREARDAFQVIMENAVKITTPDRVQGVLISHMAQKGQECIIGMTRDRVFGPVVMFGLGGIFVEVLRDVSLRLAPLSEIDIEEMIREIKGYPVLTGIRGEKPKDVQALKDVLEKISRLVVDISELAEVDLNPVIVHEKGLSIVDSRMILKG